MKLQVKGLIFGTALMTAALGAGAVSVTNTTVLPTYIGIDAAGSVAGNTATSAPGFGGSSWQQSGNTKTQIFWDATAMFGRAVTIAELESISFWTNKPGDSTQPDWTVSIYTKRTATDNSGSFYKSRLNSEPYFTSPSALASKPGGQWNQWSTSGPDALRFYDQPRTGHFGAYDDPTLASLTSGAVTFDPTGASPVTRDYRTEEILFFTLGTGSAWANGFTGSVDGFSITAGGDTVNLNLEAAVAAIPEPGTYALMGVGLLGMGLLARRRRKA